MATDTREDWERVFPTFAAASRRRVHPLLGWVAIGVLVLAIVGAAVPGRMCARPRGARPQPQAAWHFAMGRVVSELGHPPYIRFGAEDENDGIADAVTAATGPGRNRYVVRSSFVAERVDGTAEPLTGFVAVVERDSCCRWRLVSLSFES
jgi:hypothetical protein